MAYNENRRFEWDPEKDRANREKHGLSFEEASELFSSDDIRLEACDEYHSIWEDRFVAIGQIQRGVIVAVWTEPDAQFVRLISARFATARERNRYRRFLEDHLWSTFQS